MTILIISKGRDMHALVVEYCLRNAGAAVVSLNNEELVSHSTLSFGLDSKGHSWRYRNRDTDLDFAEVRTVWNRRYAQAKLPAEELHPDDLAVAEREVAEFSTSLYHSIAQQAKWVNPIESMARSSSKFAQLLQASKAGIRIPDTLVSNDPARIRDFLGDPSPSIYKSMLQMDWVEDGKTFKLATSCVTLEDLPPDRMLQLVPGIYQRRIIKRSDVRTIFLGDQHTSIRIPSKDNPAGAVDVRVTPLLRMKADLFELPDDTVRACRAMMRAFGMEFACFDFVESTDGELVFLEINPAGQFLWMEGVVPATRMLQKFLEFISDGQVCGPVAFLHEVDQPEYEDWVRQRNRLPPRVRKTDGLT
jgi:glutathione synthase/RimK-type ligase-like ATP-grasp enzyme